MTAALNAAFGALLLLAIAFVFSANKKSISLRIVLSALALQVAIGFFAFKLPAGQALLGSLSEVVSSLLGYANAGIMMVFGGLAADNVGYSFAISALPVIIFFSALMSALYYIGVMQWVVKGAGWVLHMVTGAGRVVTLNAAANIFVGQTEAPLMLKPYLPNVTKPQLFAIMTSGLASVAGTVLLAYAQMGINVEYLLAASFMAAPGGLLMAKILIPDDRGEGGEPPQDLLKLDNGQERPANVIMAAAMGAKDGLNLALNIGAMLIAFVSLIALLNGLLGLVGSGINWAGEATGTGIAVETLTVQGLLGWIFAPLMFALSVPWEEARMAGSIVGEKVIVNEFVAYLSLSGQIEDFTPRTQVILTVALCGFANLSSIGILLGGLGSLIPNRMAQIAEFGLRAVLAGTLANLMSAAIAAFLFAF